SYYAGCTPEANHELMLRAYMNKYGITGDNIEKLNLALAKVAVKNHVHALKNKFAQFHRRITIEQVLSARKNARKPLGLYDFAPISDGASALILTSSSLAKKMTDHPIYVLGGSSATDFLTFPSREDLAGFSATRNAMRKALKMANLSPLDIQLAEVYDQSTVMELISLEDLGFCEKGTAWTCIRGSCEDYDGYYEVHGKKIFVNMNGGLKADGNPIGATGGAQIFEVFKQLRNEADERQVILNENPPKFGCIQELEGFGTKAYITILGDK
ncbi:thiolase domain-containing protein, partial [Candidatus Bathyarchaeota archaeon]|nr:thiolase domain-containing protein [Candidatus Bathyarchaeota archaeon]